MKNNFLPTFRYFINHDIDYIKKYHYKTILYIENEIAIGYAHIDYDIINNKYWIGICVLSNYCGKGIGTKLIKQIIDYFNNAHFDNLHLTVDKTNIIAYKLYLKNNFIVENTTSNIYIMILKKKDILYLPVSYGEAIDKLTILDIKMNKINDSRKIDVEIEYNKINYELKNITKSISFYYNVLKIVNLLIWEDQDNFRYISKENEKNKLCKKIIENNDARFRIKNKINFILNSFLKEQKGYDLKIAYINYDNINKTFKELNALIKYLSIFNDNVIVKCLNSNYFFLKKYFSYDKSIEILLVEDFNYISSNLLDEISNINIYNYIYLCIEEDIIIE
jgi:hypothetical protein